MIIVKCDISPCNTVQRCFNADSKFILGVIQWDMYIFPCFKLLYVCGFTVRKLYLLVACHKINCNKDPFKILCFSVLGRRKQHHPFLQKSSPSGETAHKICFIIKAFKNKLQGGLLLSTQLKCFQLKFIWASHGERCYYAVIMQQSAFLMRTCILQ